MSRTASNDLEIDGVLVRAGRSLVVEGVSMRARSGEITVVIGPNGAGKTSLLEAIVGLRPREGIVRFAGVALERFSEHARTFAFMPDEAVLAAEATVRLLVGHASVRTRALDVERLFDVPAAMLSRGERQRVGLSIALSHRRPVVVLDEPLSAFDPLQMRGITAVLRDVADEGAIVVCSVHQLSEAEKIADRVLLLAAGRAVAFGTLDELRAKSETPDASLEEIFLRLLSRDAHAA